MVFSVFLLELFSLFSTIYYESISLLLLVTRKFSRSAMPCYSYSYGIQIDAKFLPRITRELKDQPTASLLGTT